MAACGRTTLILEVGDGTTETGATTDGGASSDSTGEPDSTDGGEVDSTAADSTSTGDPGFCGDGLAQSGEVCDGLDVGGLDCAAFGFEGGVLSCTLDCLDYELSGCSSALCGDGLVEGMEVCDGPDLGGLDCTSLGFDGGALQCSPDCSDFNTNACFTNNCGNGVLDLGEVCDGAELQGESCVTQGFDGGVLGCAPNCFGLELGGCFTAVCGDGVTDPPFEVCDGADLGGQSCVTQGFDGGMLACAPDCLAYDLGGCTILSCGNELVEGMEVCDGTDLAGQDCASLGFGAGTLACSPGCVAFDTSGCGMCQEQDVGSATGPAVASGNTDLEDDDLPQSCAAGGGADHVIAFAAAVAGDYVFDTNGSMYDTALVAFDTCDPGSEIACDDDSGMGLQSEITVSMAVGQSILVVVDGWNGNTGNWVLNIDPPPLPPPPACVEEDLGLTLGSPVSMGNTDMEDEDIAQPCAAGGAVDRMFRFIAPATGTFVFDTFGSGYDTALSVYADCNPASVLACNDDAMGTLQSQITIDLVLGQEIVLSVSGFAGATGDWVLDIAGP